MPQKYKWLPGGREDRLSMAKRWLEIIQMKASVWHIPTEEITDFTALISTAEMRLETAKSTDRTAVTTAQCKMAFDALVAKMRYLKSHYFLVPPLTEADLAMLELKLHDTNPTNVPVPKNEPGVEVVKWAPHLLEFRYFTATDLEDVVEYGIRLYFGLVDPVEVALAVSDGPVSAIRLTGDIYKLSKPPVQANDLPNSFFTRRKKKTVLSLPPEASGCICYMAARFENSKGDSGPWGEIIQVRVP